MLAGRQTLRRSSWGCGATKKRRFFRRTGKGRILKGLNPGRLALVFVYVLFCVAVLASFDVFFLHNVLGLGYPRHYGQENVQRYPAPYVEFTGKPNVKDHNEYGFRGLSFKAANPGDLKIAFFGGSTGYFGNPPIAKIVERELAKMLGQSVFVANYSVVSSNHRQHLHGILEFLPEFRPDLIIFYGGYNEMAGSAYYDPRPGYPYNFFYRAETKTFFKLLLENSAIVGEIDKRFGIITGLKKLKEQQQPFSESWNSRTVDKYFETLALSRNVASTIGSESFGKTKFFAFYQPYQVSEKFRSAHDEIKRRILGTDYVFDVSAAYDALGPGIYLDRVHVKQRANEVMGLKIAEVIFNEIKRP